MVADHKKADRLSPHRPGFTLVELLTVIGIIALLISILLPSLSRARMQAKKVKTAATLSAMEKGLEMFRNDFGEYPDSSAGDRLDPLNDYPVAGANDHLSGAHWLVRALIGHDSNGVDAAGAVFAPVYSDTDQISVADVSPDRKGVYMEGDIFARDTDTSRFKQVGTPDTGRPVVFDAFDCPILYYRANRRASTAFDLTGAVYNQQDNEEITGSGAHESYWDFAGAGVQHGLGDLVNATHLHGPPDDEGEYKGRTFADYLHNESAHRIAGDAGIKPYNAERFILISPSDDGVYGTHDDVNNFKSAL